MYFLTTYLDIDDFTTLYNPSNYQSGEGNGTPLQYSCLENPMDRGTWQASVHGVAKSWAQLSDFTFTFHFHALEKEMATHSIVLAWRIPGMVEPGGLPSMGSHRVGHDWSDLAAAAAISPRHNWVGIAFLKVLWSNLALFGLFLFYYQHTICSDSRIIIINIFLLRKKLFSLQKRSSNSDDSWGHRKAGS